MYLCYDYLIWIFLHVAYSQNHTSGILQFLKVIRNIINTLSRSSGYLFSAFYTFIIHYSHIFTHSKSIEDAGLLYSPPDPLPPNAYSTDIRAYPIWIQFLQYLDIIYNCIAHFHSKLQLYIATLRLPWPHTPLSSPACMKTHAFAGGMHHPLRTSHS